MESQNPFAILESNQVESNESSESEEEEQDGSMITDTANTSTKPSKTALKKQKRKSKKEKRDKTRQFHRIRAELGGKLADMRGRVHAGVLQVFDNVHRLLFDFVTAGRYRRVLPVDFLHQIHDPNHDSNPTPSESMTLPSMCAEYREIFRSLCLDGYQLQVHTRDRGKDRALMVYRRSGGGIESGCPFSLEFLELELSKLVDTPTKIGNTADDDETEMKLGIRKQDGPNLAKNQQQLHYHLDKLMSNALRKHGIDREAVLRNAAVMMAPGGRLVGEGAPALGEENVGYRLLMGMGWRPPVLNGLDGHDGLDGGGEDVDGRDERSMSGAESDDDEDGGGADQKVGVRQLGEIVPVVIPTGRHRGLGATQVQTKSKSKR